MAMTYFLTQWPSSMTYLFVNVTHWNCWPITYVDQVWWWYVKAFMSYAWQNGQTNRQTNGQTNILAKIVSNNSRHLRQSSGYEDPGPATSDQRVHPYSYPCLKNTPPILGFWTKKTAPFSTEKADFDVHEKYSFLSKTLFFCYIR